MIQKHRISTNIGNEQKITVELKQNYDLLEILSLKFTQKEIYASLCSDYGVVCGRLTANDGFGIPNAKVSIFVPVSDEDLEDPVISALYPYKISTDINDENYRYNLLPARQQHSGHKATGTFPDQSDVINREEVLEVYEKYYNFTVKTNESGDFMIWGVPIGSQTIHVDLDLSDMGCFSLRPYDFIRKGIGEEQFERLYEFKSSTNLDGLPQIVTFEKTIEVYPFWGNEELCEIGISRVDFDLGERGIRIEPISLILASAITDDNSSSIKRNGKIRKGQGYKCNLQTLAGKVECVRWTGKKVYASDGVTLYPELEYFNITETIDDNGAAMIVLPANMEYVYTNEFGEQEISTNSSKGIPTTSIARFRFSLDFKDRKITTANYLVPNIREYNSDARPVATVDESDEHFITTYTFSDVFEDYLENSTFTGGTQMTTQYKNDKKDLMLGTNNNGVPEDYFYKFIFGKVYTVSSFQGSHYQTGAGLFAKDSFLGIKEIRPSIENDCASSTNYIPTNFAFRNRIKIALIISEIVLFVQYVFALINIKVFEIVGRFLFAFAEIIGPIGIKSLGWFPFGKAASSLVKTAFNLSENGQKTLSLTIYPDCEECTSDDEAVEPSSDIDLSAYYRSAEVKTKVVPYNGFIYLVLDPAYTSTWFNTNTTSGTTFLTSEFPNDSAREIQATGITLSQLTLLQNYNSSILSGDEFPNRFAAEVYPLIGTNPTTDTFNNFSFIFDNSYTETPYTNFFFTKTVSEPANNGRSTIRINTAISGLVKAEFIDANGTQTSAPENILVTVLIRSVCGSGRLAEIYITSGTSFGSVSLNVVSCYSGGPGYLEYYQSLTSTSGSTTGYNSYPQYNSYPAVTYTNARVIQLTFEDWTSFSGIDYGEEVGNISDLYAIVRIYDREQLRTGSTTSELVIETGCQKYDKFYDESILKTYLWGEIGTDYAPIDNPSNQGTAGCTTKIFTDSYRYNSSFCYGIPNYAISNYVESTTNPNSANYTLLAAIAGSSDTLRLPNIIKTPKGDTVKFSKKTKSGLTEIRDGYFVIVPVIRGESKNGAVIREWYRRKRIGLLFCGGITNYSFIDNWLNGVLYFFKFDRRIKWDNIENYDLNKRASKYPRDLVFFNIIDEQFYYRSTPYNPTDGFTGNRFTFGTYSTGRRELLHPTTFYDIGVRDEFLKEICIDGRLDPTCSVIRDIGATSYQDPANIVEYGINYRLDTSDSTFKVEDFFNGTYLGEDIKTMDGDLIQLFSINSEAGIEAFDLDSPQYFIYNGELMDPEDNYFSTFFKSGGSYGPTPIDFKFDDNGEFIRLCLNFRLGDYSQNVPFYLWDKGGTGFGPYNSNKDNQMWQDNYIASMKLQRVYSIGNVGDSSTNYLFPDGEEEYLLRPMNIDHGAFVFTGNTYDALERFEVISLSPPDTAIGAASGYTENNLWLHVKSGTTTSPSSGYTYVVLDDTWVQVFNDVYGNNAAYVKDFREIFLFPTNLNYSGNKQVLSTPFFFYFGLRPGKTALDLFVKYFGPKLPKPSIIFSGTTGTTEPPVPTVTPTPTLPTPTPSVTPTLTPTLTLTPGVTETQTQTPTSTPTPTLTPTQTSTTTQTATPTLTPTLTQSPTLTASPTLTPTTCICTDGEFVDYVFGDYGQGSGCYERYYNCDCSYYYVYFGPSCP